MVKDLYSSYKDLPLSIYQIQTKYRDEARPRAGLLRGREFVDEGLLLLRRRRRRPGAQSYQAHRDAYIRIFDRLGFEYVIVQATSGAMGGSKSEEFLAKAEVGEDTYVRCTHCDYAANVEAVAGPRARPVAVRRRARPPTRSRRPDTPTIDTLVDAPQREVPPRGPALGGRATRSRTSWSCSSTPTAPASRSPSACPATARSTRSASRASSSRPRSSPSDEAEFAKHPALVKGYIGPGALGEESASGIRYLVDPRVVEGTRWVTGADVDGSHVLDLVAGRDFTADGTIEAAEVRDGDACPNCADGRRSRVRPRHRDGPHLPARPQVRRGARPARCSTRTASSSP